MSFEVHKFLNPSQHSLTAVAEFMAEESTIKVLIVDDEPGARRRIMRLLKKEPGMQVIGQAASGREALSSIQNDKPDLVFLDVQMPTMSGIEVVENMGAAHMPAVVFVTAYDQYAVKAFDLAALDYLMKPFDDERFEQTLARVKEALIKPSDANLTQKFNALLQAFQQTSAPNSPTPPQYIERIAVEARGQLRIVPIEQIDFITASGNYVDLHVGEEKLLVREQMQILEAKLPPRIFFRIHRSSIVRLDQIEHLIVNAGGDYAVRLSNKKLLKVSRSRWGELSLRLGIETPTGEGSV